MSAEDNVAQAEYYLDEYERIANADHYPGDREPRLARTLAIAQVHATLAVVDELSSVALSLARAEA